LSEIQTLDPINRVTSDFTKAYNAKSRKDDLFREIYRRYRGYLDVSTQTTRSTLFIPESFQVVETVSPRMTARKPSFKVIPRSSSAISKADKAGRHLDYRYDVMGLQEKNKVYAKQGLLYGTSLIKMGWDAKNKRPDAQVVDIADIFPDNETYDWQSGYIIHRFYRTVDELKASKIKYQDLDKLELQKDASTRDDTLRQDRKSIQGIPFEPNREGVEILEWWGRVDGKIHIYAVANRTILIRDADSDLPLDEFPFVPFFDQEVPFEKWGIGEIEPILDLQDEENTTRNQRIDEKNLSIHNMWICSKMAGIDYRTLVSKPGGVVLANDINGIKPLEKQKITQNSIEEIRLIKEYIKNTTGTVDAIRGNNSNGTATQAVIDQSEGNQRFAEKVNNFEIALKKIGKWILALDAAFLTDDIDIMIEGKFGTESEKITLDDINDEYDIDIESGSSLPANPDLRRQQLRELLQVIYPILTNPAGIPDGLREFLRTLIQSYDLKNTDEILKGSQPKEVDQAMANLDQTEMGDVNPQMVEAEIKKQLMASGQLGQMGQMGQMEQPPMREQLGETTIQ
jgi:hypothetical protein